MGMLVLNRLMSLQRDRQRRRWQLRARCRRRRITSAVKRKGSPCQQDGDGISRAGKIMRSSIPDLPEEILFHIHSLMPMREAARAACVSRAFLHSWRCRPNLIFDKDTIGLKINGCGGKLGSFHHKINRILKKHSGIGLKTFNLDYSGMHGFEGGCRYFDRWIQIALKPGIEKLTIWWPGTRKIYKFPCSLLSDGVRNSLQHLELHSVAFHPTVELGPLRSLTILHLCCVRITWDELECLLCHSLGLEQLELSSCTIACLKVPSSLQRLSSLTVCGVRVIESKAPNLSSLSLSGNRLNFSHMETLQVKKLAIDYPNSIGDARVKLPSNMPNLETLVISSRSEVVDAPMLPTKFLCLKHLTIKVVLTPYSRLYDCCSLVSFLDAAPSLETFELDMSQPHMLYQSVFEDSQLRHMPACHLGCLQSMKISGFSSAKCLVDLACYILKNAVSLECLTLDTMYGYRCGEGNQKYCRLQAAQLREGHRALAAVRTYIENKVPSKLN